jgi:hypothetical protein
LGDEQDFAPDVLDAAFPHFTVFAFKKLDATREPE